MAKKSSTLTELVGSVESRQANEGAGEDLFKEAEKLVRQDHQEYFSGVKVCYLSSTALSSTLICHHCTGQGNED